MPPRIDSPPAWTNGHLVTGSGILVPPSSSISNLRSPNVPPHVSAIIRRANWGVDLWSEGQSWGYELTKNPNTGAILLPQKGSGSDDLLNAALVDGELKNIGVTPILNDQIIGILNRQISQAKNSDITISGRKSPVSKAKEAISYYNDSPLGYTGAVGQIVYQMRTFNRGAPHATVPIMYPVDQWVEYGLTAIPMPKPGEKEETTHTFYLDVDWETHGTPIPYLPSVFDLEATGDYEWPYWYSFFPRPDNKRCWILLHWTQIIGLVAGHSARCGIGTSSAWASWGFLIDWALEKQRRAEKLQHEPSNEIVAIGGIAQDADEIKQSVLANREVEKANGRVVDRGVTFFASKEAINIESHSFREAPADFEIFKQDTEDRIVLLWEEPLVALVTRGGIGYGVQSDEAQEGSADVGVQSILSCIGQALGSIYPRVQVVVSRPNDATKTRQLENFDKLAAAIQKLPEGTLNPAEIRALIPLTGITIPMVDADEAAEAATNDESDQDNDQSDNEQDENQKQDEMSRRIDGLVLEAYSIRSMQSIDEALTSDDYIALRSTIEAGLLAQYQSATIDMIVADVRAAGIDLDAAGATVEIAEIVARHAESAQDTTDLELLALLLLALAGRGQSQAEEDAIEQIDRDLTPAERRALGEDNFVTADERVNELYVEATGESTDTQPLDDPRASQVIDVESFSVLAALIAAAMRQVEDSQVRGVVQEQLPDRAATRANGIAGIEAERFYALGLMRGAGTLGAATKTWLPSRARRPRDIHIAQYGVTVDYNSNFPSGEFWSQETWNCQCSVQVNYV